MATIRDVVLDCARPAALARFGAATLDGYEVAYDDAELAHPSPRVPGSPSPRRDKARTPDWGCGPRRCSRPAGQLLPPVSFARSACSASSEASEPSGAAEVGADGAGASVLEEYEAGAAGAALEASASST